MAQDLNISLLAGTLKSHRGGKSLKVISEEMGVSVATLSRIEQGKIPDVDTFIRICRWLGQPTDFFILNADLKTPTPPSNQEVIIAHLRADRGLDPETVNMIVKVVDLAYLHNRVNA